MIFLVDADSATQDSLRILLECEGFRVNGYSSARRFLENARPGRGDCIIIDDEEIGMSGIELVEALRRRGEAAAAILVTGRANAAQRRRAATSGSIDILEKPYAAEDMIGAVRATQRLQQIRNREA